MCFARMFPFLLEDLIDSKDQNYFIFIELLEIMGFIESSCTPAATSSCMIVQGSSGTVAENVVLSKMSHVIKLT